MNHKLIYQIEFYSYWHAGSGLAGSTYADSIVNRNSQNLPIIPGKTIKGLLRDAAEHIRFFDEKEKIISQDFINEIFGKRSEKGNSTYRDEGKAFFTNAALSEKLSEKITKLKLEDELFTVLSSTEIDENGQAKDGSLRQLEVTVPLILYGTIEQIPDKKYEEQLLHCFGWIKQLGQNRNRGLGKCKFSIVKN